MQPLSPQAQARLAAFRRAESPDDEVAARCLVALERRVAENVAEPASNRGRFIAPVVAALTLAAGLALAVQWVVTTGAREPEIEVAAPYQSGAPRPAYTVQDAPPVVPVDEVAPEVVPPAVMEGAREVEGPELERDAAPAVRDVRARAPGETEVKRPRSRSADDLAVEVALLREAKLAAPARRLELLTELARRFPTGALAAERGLLEIEARCGLGEVDAARALARRFAQRFPGSSLAARAAKVCADDLNSP